jgi:hypothetical protein
MEAASQLETAKPMPTPSKRPMWRETEAPTCPWAEKGVTVRASVRAAMGIRRLNMVPPCDLPPL